MQDFAASTPFDLEQVAAAFVQLRTSGIDPMDGTLKTLGDAAAAMGKDVQAAAEMYADALRGENGRLEEFGIVGSKAGDQITYAWTVNGKRITRTVKANSREISKALREIFDSRFDGAMAGRPRP